MTNSQKSKILENAGLAVFGIIIFLIIFELLLIFAIPTSFIPYQFDVIGGKYIPNSSGQNVSQEFFVKFKTNSIGFIDEEHPIEKANDVYRIAIIGDSFVETNQVEFQKTWTKD